MDSYEIIMTDDATADLVELRDYIAEVLLAPETALSYIRAIRKEISTLTDLPDRIKLVDDEPWHSRGIRKIIAKTIIGLMNQLTAMLPITSIGSEEHVTLFIMLVISQNSLDFKPFRASIYYLTRDSRTTHSTSFPAEQEIFISAPVVGWQAGLLSYLCNRSCP